MKLLAGQRTHPVPCPIHSNPISAANTPIMMSRVLRIFIGGILLFSRPNATRFRHPIQLSLA